MNTEQINDRLAELFNTHRVIFWNDPDAEFEDFISGLSMDGIEILRPDKIGQLRTKVLIEIDKPDQKFIVYVPSPEPAYDDDWLLDIRLYSYQFHADRSSMILEELGLQTRSLREHISKRAKFFNNKERLERLKKVIAPSDTETEIDNKMIAVLAKSDSDNFFDVVNSIFSAYTHEGIEKSPECWDDIVKFGLEDVFWHLAESHFGYKDESPSLQKLLCCLFVADLYAKVGDNLGDGLSQFILPEQKQANAVVCLNSWRDSLKLTENYDRVAHLVERHLDINKYLADIPREALMDAVTFVAVERACASYLKETVLAEDDPFDAETIRDYARKRQDMYWANDRLKDTQYAPRSDYLSVYEAILQATQMVELKKAYISGFSFDYAGEGFGRYTGELYRFDRAYRRFHESAKPIDEKGWDVLKGLKERVENIYSNSFLEPLTLAWEKVADLKSWRIDGISNQYDFWGRYPGREIGDDKAPVFVVISDGLRYEVATELMESINGKYRFSASLNAMLGCVPSYTGIGMAVLLPHDSMGISEKGDAVIDGKTVASMQQRSQMLERYKGVAIDSKELTGFTRDEARDFARDRNVIYVYHNIIDATGDAQKTETKAFSAVREALDELESIVSRAINDLHARYVYITADHGFVYTESKPDDPDHSDKIDKSGAVKTNKRYLLGNYLPGVYDAHHGFMSKTAGAEGDSDMGFLVPKGMSLFYFTGGSRYFHGGISLQEIAIPVLTIEHIRGRDKEKTRERVVRIQLLGTSHVITTGRHRFQFLQLDAVSERVKTITVKAGIYDGNTPVSDIHTVSFDSATDDMSQRTRDVIFILQNLTFDPKRTYKLIARDAGSDKEILSAEVRIDRTFTEDF